MIMIFPQALYAFLISIFAPGFPQDMMMNPPYANPALELRSEKELSVARPMELIDGSYVVKK